MTRIAIEELRRKHPGLVIVASAGNDRTDTPTYPAALTSVIAVGSVTEDDERADYSNYGKWVDVSAPGYAHSTFVEWDDTRTEPSTASPRGAGRRSRRRRWRRPSPPA